MLNKETATESTDSKSENAEKRVCSIDDYDTFETTSAKIRAMFADGFKVAEIARSGLKTKNGDAIRYQHVRNVLIQSSLLNTN